MTTTGTTWPCPAAPDAFFPAPGNAPYCTAKHALVGLSLSLRLEGVDLGVKVSCVCPGFVRTNVYQNAEAVNLTLPAEMTREQVAGAPAKMMEPARAARVILDGVVRNRALIVFPASIRWARRSSFLLPRLGDSILLRQMRGYLAPADAGVAEVPDSRGRVCSARHGPGAMSSAHATARTGAQR